LQSHRPGFRPANLTRSAVHALSGVLALLVIQHVVTTPRAMFGLALGFAVWAWGMEIGRRRSQAVNRLLMRLFGPIAHPHERERINSATWYVTALLALSLTASPMACSLAVIVLGIGDPAASFVGRRFGRHRLASGRSVEGSLGFVVFAAAAAAATLFAYYPALSFGEVAALAFASAAAGALAELLTASLDDNLVIPLAAAAGATLVAAAFG
jgi:dolichol kinase